MVGVTVSGGDETVDIGVMGVSLGDERAEVVDRGTNELEGLCVVVAGWAGPITCHEWINRGLVNQGKCAWVCL